MTKSTLKHSLLVFSLACGSQFASASSLTVGNYNMKPAPRVANYSNLRNDIVNYAKEWVGLRYISASKTPDNGGFDCSGFTNFLFNQFNLSISNCSRSQANEGEHITLEMARPGDLVFFGSKRGGISHVSLVVSNDENGLVVCHSTSSRGVIVENITESSYWSRKLLFARNIIDEQFINEVPIAASGSEVVTSTEEVAK